MKIAVNNRQTQHRLSRLRIRRLAAWLLRPAVAGAANPAANTSCCGGASPAHEWNALEIILTDDAGMVAVNQAAFGRKASTDVISQAYAPLPNEPGGAGEVIVNVALAAREGARRAGGPDRELALYLAHGCDHLGGASDATAAGRAAMRRRERGWLAAAARAGLLDGLFSRGSEYVR